MEQFPIGSVVLLWVVVICNLLLTLALVRRVNAKGVARPKEGLKEGEMAPDFTAETLRGEKVTLATYAQREIAFLFISPLCRPCREALPQYEALGPRTARLGVDTILVSTGDAEQTRALVDEFSIRLPILVAPAGSNTFMEDYKLSITPSYSLINRQGGVESSGYLNLKGDIWKRFVEAQQDNEISQGALTTSERR